MTNNIIIPLPTSWIAINCCQCITTAFALFPRGAFEGSPDLLSVNYILGIFFET